MTEFELRLVNAFEDLATAAKRVAESLEGKKAPKSDRAAAVQVALFEPVPAGSVALSIPTTDGGDLGVSSRYVDELATAYPAVDVPQTIKEARVKIMSGAVSKPTKRGAGKFLTDWIAREQNIIAGREARASHYTANNGRAR